MTGQHLTLVETAEDLNLPEKHVLGNHQLGGLFQGVVVGGTLVFPATGWGGAPTH